MRTANKPSKRKAAKLLRIGAKNIETYGWVKGRFGSSTSGGYCALGSFGFGRGNSEGFTFSDQWLAECALAETVPGGDVVDFNDRMATTKEEVTKLMRKTARLLEHGLQVNV